jgi:hypothetical protein
MVVGRAQPQQQEHPMQTFRISVDRVMSSTLHYHIEFEAQDEAAARAIVDEFVLSPTDALLGSLVRGTIARRPDETRYQLSALTATQAREATP